MPPGWTGGRSSVRRRTASSFRPTGADEHVFVSIADSPSSASGAHRAPARADRAGDRDAGGSPQRRLGALAGARRRVRPSLRLARHRLSLDLGVGRLALRAEPALGARAGPRRADAPRAAADPGRVRGRAAELLEGPCSDPGRRRGGRGRPARARPPRDRRPARAHGPRRPARRSGRGRRPGARELRPLALGRRRWLPAPAREARRPTRGRCCCVPSTRRARRWRSAAPTRAPKSSHRRTVPRDRLLPVEPSGSAEPPAEVTAAPSRTPTNAESLTAIAEHALARPPTGLAGGERNQVIVHVDAATLATDVPRPERTGAGACSVADGPGIAAETARRLACDCSLVAALNRSGRTVDVGRRTRRSRRDPPGARGARRPLSVPGVRAPPIRRRAPPRPLGAGRRDQPRQPRPALSPSPPTRPRGRLRGRGPRPIAGSIHAAGWGRAVPATPGTRPSPRAPAPAARVRCSPAAANRWICARARTPSLPPWARPERYGSGGSRSCWAGVKKLR